ncbi:MAG: pantetheine-phosphate adenylyltransferase [Clostridium sp.]|uniref:pantetheine-phosphate adenylyltransferase n=1 Tax=Clostridium sp. TaxID=1506 RepID=UPI003F2C0FB7
MKVAVYPGSFDPITNGHLEIIKRGTKIFDKVIVAVLINVDKKGLFSIDERIKLIRECTKDLGNVEVISFDGMLVDLLKEKNVGYVLKGLRNTIDFEYERNMEAINRILNKNIETVYLISSEKNICVSSSAVRQICKFNGDISFMVPPCIKEDIERKVRIKD